MRESTHSLRFRVPHVFSHASPLLPLFFPFHTSPLVLFFFFKRLSSLTLSSSRSISLSCLYFQVRVCECVRLMDSYNKAENKKAYVTGEISRCNIHMTAQFPLKMLHSRNLPNRETQFTRYLVVQKIRIWIRTQEFEFLEMVDFGGVALSVASVIQNWLYTQNFKVELASAELHFCF